MAEDFGELLAAIRRVFPQSRFEPVAEAALEAIRQRHSGIPEHYLEFLRRIGWGTLGDGNFMVYSAPSHPGGIFDEQTAADLDGLQFFGDNFSGWHWGFDTRSNWKIVSVSSASARVYTEEAHTVSELIAQRITDREG